MDNLEFAAEAVTAEVRVREYRSPLERAGRALLLLLAFLLPVFFIPSVSFPFAGAKSLLVSLLVLAALALYLIARLKDGVFVFPRSALPVALGCIVVLFALSGVLSGSTANSLVGQTVEVGTVVSILIGVVLAAMVPLLFRSKDQIFASYLAFLAAFFLIALFHLLRLLFGPELLSLSLFRETVSNTIGKWNDLGVFFGASTLLSLVTIEFLSLNRLFRFLVYLALTLSLFFLALVNFSAIWVTLGLFALVFLVYLISFGPSRTSSQDAAPERVFSDFDRPRQPAGAATGLRRIPIPSLLVLLISVLFMLAGGTLGGGLSTTFGISQIEARPSWQATFDVSRHVLIEHPLLGAGPNQFSRSWLQFKPAGINQTIFWNTDFSYGVGLVPTFLVTSGIFGALAWVLFFLLLLYTGFRAILSDFTDAFSRYLVTSSFLVSLFLWVFSIFYVPSVVIFSLTFLFTGLFIAALAAAGLMPARTLSFSDDPRAGFVSVLLLILLLIGSVTLGFFLTERYAAAVYFQRGVLAANREGNVETAERLIARAAAITTSDLYHRFLSEIALIRINTLLAQNANAVSAESVRSAFQTLLASALGSARQAVALDQKNYENLMQLGRVYEAVVPLRIEGAYENAKATYENALALNPHSPAILLTLARLEIAKGDNAKAREGIARALQEKGNYTEAIFLLSQIEAREGNIKAAISSVEAASIIAPNDPAVFFQLGLLRFNDRDFRGAASALERAVALNPAYANAKYFLGLSYERLGRDADAIRQFSDLQATNPDNKEIELILQNLKASRDPFAAARPPIDATPEKRPRLPVEERDSGGKKEAEE